ncbi:MAG: LytTR family transcriptional regulator DNA-binding domain-containing protein [Burkholderiales bacterium]|nr:LytTR family transcriptional regulator DNA-binding domain-containing protein [Burkholderiales bacterium]
MKADARLGATLRYLGVAGLALLALILSLQPDVGFQAPPAARLMFWSLQIGIGLAVLQTALYLLSRKLGATRVPSWALVLASAVLGAALLAPIYWLIGEGLMQQILGYPARPDDDADDNLESRLGHQLLAEYFDIVGPVTTSWALICLPRLHWLVPPLLHPPAVKEQFEQEPGAQLESAPGGDATAATAPSSPMAHEVEPRIQPAQGATALGVPAPGVAALAPEPRAKPAWRERLPRELGEDIIAVASELQYLRVWTPRGCALILGALADVELDGADNGLRVHRSWWVASSHVRKVRRTATGAICLMSDGRAVPVSRRRRADVLARFGDGVQYRAPPSSERVTDPDLH